MPRGNAIQTSFTNRPGEPAEQIATENVVPFSADATHTNGPGRISVPAANVSLETAVLAGNASSSPPTPRFPVPPRVPSCVRPGDGSGRKAPRPAETGNAVCPARSSPPSDLRTGPIDRCDTRRYCRVNCGKAPLQAAWFNNGMQSDRFPSASQRLRGRKERHMPSHFGGPGRPDEEENRLRLRQRGRQRSRGRQETPGNGC